MALDFSDTRGWTQPSIWVTFFAPWCPWECHSSDASTLISSSDLQFSDGHLVNLCSFSWAQVHQVGKFILALRKESGNLCGSGGSWWGPTTWFWRNSVILWCYFSHLYEKGLDQWLFSAPFLIIRTLSFLSLWEEIWHGPRCINQTKSVYSGGGRPMVRGGLRPLRSWPPCSLTVASEIGIQIKETIAKFLL